MNATSTFLTAASLPIKHTHTPASNARMALHHHGCGCASLLVLALALLLVLVDGTLATPRFEPAVGGPSNESGKGLARSSNAIPANESRSRSAITSGSAASHRVVPEALRRFNFNARKADLTRTPPKNAEDSDSDSEDSSSTVLDWTSHGDEDVTTTSSTSLNQHELADIALVVTVDGSIHAIKRETGTWVWSLHDENKREQKQEVVQNPLVRSSMRNASSSSSSSSNGTSSTDINDNSGENVGHTDDDDDDDEIYIIEPHAAGDIYVYHKSTGKLQRLPLSLTQLVELSPFTFPVRGSTADNDGINTDNKLFVGRKESKLVGVDLKTGKLVGVFGPEAGWCEWPQTPSRGGGSNTAASPGRSAVPEEEAIENRPRDLLYLGQTDYHLSIYSKTQGLLQTLSYTSYGPSSLAQHTTSPIGPLTSSAEEAEYQTSHDGRYIQPMHDGSLICLNPEREGIQWTNRFSQPVVGIFDIWYPATDGENAATSSNQSQPVLSIHPHHRVQSQLEELGNIPPSTFVGKITHHSSSSSDSKDEEFYAMSDYHFPLVSFAPASQAISASSPNGNQDEQDGQNRSRPRQSIVGSHRVGEPIDSGRTIEATPTPLGIDPPETPAGLPDSDSTARPALPPAYEAGYRESIFRYLSISGGLEARVSLVETMFLLGGLLIFSFAFMRRKMRSGRPSSRDTISEQIKAEEAGEQNSHIPAIENSTSTTGSYTPPTEQSSLLLPNENAAGMPPRRMPSHASNPSLDKALPALPVEDTIPVQPNEVQSDDEDNGEDNGEDNENGLEKARNPKKGRRRKRGGKRNNKNGNNLVEDKNGQSSPETSLKEELVKESQDIPMVVVDSAPVVVAKDRSSSGRVGSLEVSESVLGYGSHGTVVLKGTFQGRAVAVKRLLKDFITVATHEVSLLQESDDHPNVIRYFCKESHENFHYIALELCPTSLFELIDTPQAFPSIIANFDATKALKQMTRGLAHLHKLKIIHRDLKPQNILVATSPGKKPSDGPVVRLVISDFGLCKKLDLDESSFLQSVRGGGNHAPGSFGYRAPEVLRGEVDADDLINNNSGGETGKEENSLGSRSTSTSSTATVAMGERGGRKLTRAIDIFSLGCIFYFVLTMGEHPFGSRYEREINILNDKIGLDGLSVMTEERYEAQELIRHMCASDPRVRPTANDILVDPLFWSASHSLHFLCDASDRFEILGKDHFVLGALEADAPDIVGIDWLKNLDRNLIDNLGKYRKYDGGSVRDLLRVMRNKKHHYQDLPENVRRSLGEPPAGFLSYFTKRFPKLLLHVHTIVKQYLAAERMFNAYFEHEDS